MDLIHVKRLLAWDKKLYCMFMDRDPRDIVVSQHGSRPGEYWCDFPIWERNQKLIAPMRNHPRVHICRYENLVTDPDGEQDRIAATFPFLRKTYDFSDFEKVSQSSEAAQLALKGVRKISANSVGSWRQNLPRLCSQLRDHPQMAEAVAAAGYSADASWMDVCEGVVPDDTESVRARHDPLRNMHGPARLLARLRRRGKSLTLQTIYTLRCLLD